jgi:hypothetical protein
LLPIVAGNVRRERLLEVYLNDPVFERLCDPDRVTGKCGSCDYRYMCGGSRARAYAFEADPFASEPCCAYENTGPPDLMRTRTGVRDPLCTGPVLVSLVRSSRPRRRRLRLSSQPRMLGASCAFL